MQLGAPRVRAPRRHDAQELLGIHGSARAVLDTDFGWSAMLFDVSRRHDGD